MVGGGYTRPPGNRIHSRSNLTVGILKCSTQKLNPQKQKTTIAVQFKALKNKTLYIGGGVGVDFFHFKLRRLIAVGPIFNSKLTGKN